MDDTTAPKTIKALWSMTAVSLAIIALRFYCKIRYSKKFGLDDIIVSISWSFLLVYTVLTTISCQFGIGQHLAQISAEDLPIGLRLLYIGRFFGIIACATSKTSFAVTLLRLAAERWHLWMIWFIILSLNVVMWLCALFLFVECSPVEKAWLLSTPGTCWNPTITIDYSIFAGIYSGAMDFTLALFPWILVWKLQMKRREKIGIALAMSLGVLAGITAVIKTTFMTGTSRNNDFTYTSADLLIWSASETAVTIVASSIPFLRLMIMEVSNRSRHYGTGYHLEDVNSYKSRGVIVETSRRVVTVEASTSGPDDKSDKSILGKGKGGDSVLVIKEVTLEYCQGYEESQNGTEKRSS